MAIETRIARKTLTKEETSSWIERVLSWVFVREDISSRSDVNALYMRRFHILSEKLFPRSVWSKNSSKWPKLKAFLEKMPGLYIHCFYRSDEDPDPHCHPFSFISLVLAGGYFDEEWVVDAKQRRVSRLTARTPGGIAYRPAEHIHRAKLIDPTKRTWTVIFRSGRKRPWYFYTDAGPMYWETYLKSKRTT